MSKLAQTTQGPLALIIMDGYGLNSPGPHNAISLADTPCLDALFARCPHTCLDASEQAVGLPSGQMGNSEVGHLNIGAGRVIYQELTRINRAVADGSLETNPVLAATFAKLAQSGGCLHLMGLLSDGGVHSSKDHLYALIAAAQKAQVSHICIHAFMDGRDVSPTSGVHFVEELQDLCDKQSTEGCKIELASMSGRYYAMDRDNRFERVERAWKAMTCAEPLQTDLDPVSYIKQSYAQGVTDEFIEPCAFVPQGIRTGDALVCFNFRPDRAREITRAFTEEDFTGFERPVVPCVSYVCLTQYDERFDLPVAFPKEFPDQVLADVLAQQGLRQYHIAETEKYAHVTFFFNGGREEPKPGEERALIASPKVPTYDLKPEMSAYEVAHTLADAISHDVADVYIVNFANCDMVGHTGSIPATIKAVEAVDACVGIVLSALEEKSGMALITADHGNADCMLDEKGNPMTSHTTYRVPLILVGADEQTSLKPETGALSNISPTILDILGIEKPEEMTAESWLVRG